MRGRCGAVVLAAVLLALIVVMPAGALAKGPQVEARAWALIDARSGEVLVSHAGTPHPPIASTTKLMTAYVVLHEMPLDRIVRAVPYHAEYGESLLGLRPGQRISVRRPALRPDPAQRQRRCLQPRPRCCRHGDPFVAQMNRYAAALGLSDTHYANPVGLDQRGNYSSARDLATLTQHLLADSRLRSGSPRRAAPSFAASDPQRRITTINELLGMAPWVTGVKTGHTFGALYVLVGSGRRKGVELISVAWIGAPTDEDRFSDNLDLLEYGFAQYRRRLPIRAGTELADPSIQYAGGELPLRAARSVAVGVRPDQHLTVAVRAPQQVEGPIRRGARTVTATVYVDGLRAAMVPLRAAHALPKASLVDRARSFLSDEAIPVAIAIFVILMGAALLWRLLRRREEGEDQMLGREERRAMGEQQGDGRAAK